MRFNYHICGAASLQPTPAKADRGHHRSRWAKPIDIEAMSAVARTCARSPYRQFKRDRGYSPADFAKRIRLDRARETLEQAQGNASVTPIALKCGQNPGHFARDFRLAFGELPSDILRRSGRRLTS
jgi:transcriptional regulator GlxA family with amidase domain